MIPPTIARRWTPSPNQPFEFVDTESSLQQTVEELLEAKEIAIDLENHSFRSFQGFSCLMQISTREKDYVIDSMKLRAHMQTLSVVFSNPSIVKVFHGCESDVLWLQRDFSLYVVNCFDTYHAAKYLKYPALSLAHLVKFHCDVVLNKKLQLADWRQRPLSEELIIYAKSDTHYLLFVYDCLRIALQKARGGSEGLEYVLDASRKTCLKRYEKERFWPLGYRRLLRKAVSDRQDAALAALWKWRDALARLQDESSEFIMANAELLRVGLALPQTVTELQACGLVSEIVSKPEVSLHLVELVAAAIANGPVKVVVKLVTSDDNDNSFLLPTSASAPVTATTHSSPTHTKRSREETICTFNPVTSQQAKMATLTDVRSDEKMNIDEICELAGWKNSTDSCHFSNVLQPVSEVSAATIQSVHAAIQTLLDQQKLVNPVPVNVSVTLPDSTLNETSEMEIDGNQAADQFVDAVDAAVDTAVDTDAVVVVKVENEDSDRPLVDIVYPQSIREIYQISNRNRGLNKQQQKKREREGEADGDDDDVDDAENAGDDIDVKCENVDSQTGFDYSRMSETAGVVGAHMSAQSPAFTTSSSNSRIPKGGKQNVSSKGSVAAATNFNPYTQAPAHPSGGSLKPAPNSKSSNNSNNNSSHVGGAGKGPPGRPSGTGPNSVKEKSFTYSK